MAHPHLTRLLVLAAALGAAACGGAPTQPPPVAATSTSPAARTYLDRLITVMRANSINRLTIDWNAFSAAVFAEAASAQTIADTYPAIRKALELLGDGHSSYRTPAGSYIFVRLRPCTASGASVPPVPADIGYVKVTAFSGSTAEATEFANRLQATIRAADHDEVEGWIVDLRGNGGGNMWPMIAGVGPVLGEGILGYFIRPTGEPTMWEYRDGASRVAGAIAQQVSDPYRLRQEHARVAVLVDNGVASSGEATFIAFVGRPATRSFGAPTCGLSTSNAGFSLSDGATLFLTTSVMADRTKRAYGDALAPDEVIESTDQAVARAIAWLRSGS